MLQIQKDMFWTFSQSILMKVSTVAAVEPSLQDKWQLNLWEWLVFKRICITLCGISISFIAIVNLTIFTVCIEGILSANIYGI